MLTNLKCINIFFTTAAISKNFHSFIKLNFQSNKPPENHPLNPKSMKPINPFVNEGNGKTAGIISYFFIIGWLIAYFGFYINNRTSLAGYQLRQTLLFHLVSMVLRFGVAMVLGLIWLSTGMFSVYSLMRIVYFILFIMWIIGFIGAINGEKKPIPFIGETAQNMFAGI
jgi:uncharacterized membrane protein